MVGFRNVQIGKVIIPVHHGQRLGICLSRIVMEGFVATVDRILAAGEGIAVAVPHPDGTIVRAGQYDLRRNGCVVRLA